MSERAPFSDDTSGDAAYSNPYVDEVVPVSEVATSSPEELQLLRDAVDRMQGTLVAMAAGEIPTAFHRKAVRDDVHGTHVRVGRRSLKTEAGEEPFAGEPFVSITITPDPFPGSAMMGKNPDNPADKRTYDLIDPAYPLPPEVTEHRSNHRQVITIEAGEISITTIHPKRGQKAGFRRRAPIISSDEDMSVSDKFNLQSETVARIVGPLDVSRDSGQNTAPQTEPLASFIPGSVMIALAEQINMADQMLKDPNIIWPQIPIR